MYNNGNRLLNKKKRIRDIIFPENTKIRNFLRILNTSIRKINIKNIKKLIKIVKQIGIKRTIANMMKNLRNYNIDVEREKCYKSWMKNNEPTIKELKKQRDTKFEYEPKISILVPMYNTPYNFFEDLVNCLINQTYTNWELCLADGSPKKDESLQSIIEKDKRIKYRFLNGNKGIAGNTNECIKMATGEYIALFDHDDLLPLNALYEIVKTINENPNVEFIYTDEDKISDTDGHRFGPHFKPDFSLDFLRSNNYICHFSVFKKEIMDKLEGERSKYDGAQDFDIILRMAEIVKKENIIHIPKILYHWRAHPNSTAQSETQAKPYAFEAGIKVIEDHLDRVGLKGKVEHGASLGTYKIQYEIIGEPKVSIIIPNKDAKKYLQQCIESIFNETTYKNYEIIVVENNSEKEETFEYYKELENNKKVKIIKYPEKGFNYSKIINYGVKNCEGEYVIQLNSDTKIITKNWIETMLGFAQRDDVGAVGARLYYPDYTIQHAGIAIGVDGVAAHLFRGLPKNIHGYFSRESTIQNFSAVTAACMMNKKTIYDEVGYMNEDLPVAFNDLDFCLRIRKKDKLIVYNPFVELIHYESKIRGYDTTPERKKEFLKEIDKFKSLWPEIYQKGDPYYNINFSNKYDQYEIKELKIREGDNINGRS